MSVPFCPPARRTIQAADRGTTALVYPGAAYMFVSYGSVLRAIYIASTYSQLAILPASMDFFLSYVRNGVGAVEQTRPRRNAKRSTTATRVAPDGSRILRDNVAVLPVVTLNVSFSCSFLK